MLSVQIHLVIRQFCPCHELLTRVRPRSILAFVDLASVLVLSLRFDLASVLVLSLRFDLASDRSRPRL